MIEDMTEDPLLIAVQDGVATLTLNRPSHGNALDLHLARALAQAAIRCAEDGAIRCVVLTGAGRVFCAGGDLTAMSEAGELRAPFLSELAGTLHMAISSLMRMPKPLLVLVNGAAAGAGLSLAICGDVVLAARSAHFTAAYGAVGLSPDGGMTWLLPRLVGLRKAQEIILRNRRISAGEAEHIGLVTAAVADELLPVEGRAAAAELAGAATIAVGAARDLLVESFSSGLEAQLAGEARRIATAARTPECDEGLAAFLARRKPDFTRL